MLLDAPPLAASAAGLVVRSTVNVLYGGRTVAKGVPVGGGSLICQADQDVPERVDLALPGEWGKVTLDPGRGGVLGALGHQIQLTVHLSTPDGSRHWRQERGRFIVQEWQRDGAGVRLAGRGLLQAVVDRQRARPYAAGRPSPISGEVLSILALCGLEGWLDPRLSVGRRVPADFVQGEDVWAAFTELLTAWPARARMDGYGAIRLLPGLPADLPAPDVWWHDGRGGTVVGAPSEGTRDGAFSHVIVKVRPEDDDVVVPPVEDWVRRGPLNVDTFGWVSRVIESDAVTTTAQAEAVAANELARAGVRAKTVPVEMVPDWRVELDDVAHVQTSDGVREVGRVTGIELPLVGRSDARARCDVGVVA